MTCTSLGFSFLLCYQGHDAYGEVVSLGHVSSYEPNARVLECEEEGGIPGEAVSLGGGIESANGR